MKKGILCILLSILMLVPLFASCQKVANLDGTEVSVYTLYTIVDEATTDEAINQVELALNRILFYRLGVILKLETVTADEYEKLIDDKLAEMEAYQLQKKSGNITTDYSSTDDDLEGYDGGKGYYTGDDILDILADGKDIPLSEPRLDIFLVQGYDKYYELASTGRLAQLDEKLNNEAKALKSYIHETLFTAAKVDNKTFGVPVNNAIGEYTYLVFDKEILDECKIDPNTLESMEDLQDYLKMVSEKYPDVVPLKNAMGPTNIGFLSQEGFPAFVNNGAVAEAYKFSNFKNYYAMIARYKALNYLADSVETEDGTEDNNRYAVRIEKGNIDTIEARLADTGYEYKYSMYSVPVATNENTIDNIFCVSEYVVSSDLTDVMKIMTAINTDPELMNILTYGVENEHYTLTDDGQVERRNDNPNNVYIIDTNHVGNAFISYTLKDENPDKWNNAIKQNHDAVASPSLGFTSSLQNFKYKETLGNVSALNAVDLLYACGGSAELTIKTEVKEPDYIALINSVVDKYYPALLSGTAVEFDYDALYEQAKKEVEEEYKSDLTDIYETSKLIPYYKDLFKTRIENKEGATLLEEKLLENQEYFFNETRKDERNSLKNKYTEENPEATQEEINAYINEVLTDEYITSKMPEYGYTDEYIRELSETECKTEIDERVEEELEAIQGTSEYSNRLKSMLGSAEFKKDLEQKIQFNAEADIQAKIDAQITTLIDEYTAKIQEECNTVIEAAVNEFIETEQAATGLTREEILIKINYLKEKKTEENGDAAGGTAGDTSADTSTETSDGATEGDAEGEGETVVEYEEAYKSWFEFAFKEKIEKVYLILHPIA